MRHINEVSESAEVSAAVDDAGGPAPRAAFRPHSAADPVEDDSGGFFSSTKMIVMLIGIAAGMNTLALGIWTCWRKHISFFCSTRLHRWVEAGQK